VRLIQKSLLKAITDPSDMEARQDMLLASFMGGMALSMAGTAAVHALAYPLGKRGVPHGAANSMLFEHIMPALLADGEELTALLHQLPLPTLADFRVSKDDVPAMAKEAMLQTRLLKNHPKPLAEDDATGIYLRLFQHAPYGAS
jgi:alcohol dehydrogenase class IV